MYSKCPHCSTVFRVRADQLTAAHGQVRCGECGGLFNALQSLTDRLADDEPQSAPLEQQDEAGAAGDTGPARRPDVSSAGESLAEAYAGSGLAELEEADTDSTADLAAEEDEPPHEATYWIVEPDEPTPASGRTAAPSRDDSEEASLEFDLPPEQWGRVFGEPVAGRRIDVAGAAGADEDEEPDIELFDALEERAGRRRSWWFLGSVALALLMLLQLFYHYRESLLTDADTAAYAERVYRLFGVEPPLILDLRQYSLSRGGATATSGAGGAAGTLTILATLRNEADRRQPLPLLRVVLQDRWGEEVGARVFEPAEYVAGAAGDRLDPGQTVDVRLAILDPGTAASGYDIDLCRRDDGERLSCEG